MTPRTWEQQGATLDKVQGDMPGNMNMPGGSK